MNFKILSPVCRQKKRKIYETTKNIDVWAAKNITTHLSIGGDPNELIYALRKQILSERLASF